MLHPDRPPLILIAVCALLLATIVVTAGWVVAGALNLVDQSVLVVQRAPPQVSIVQVPACTTRPRSACRPVRERAEAIAAERAF